VNTIVINVFVLQWHHFDDIVELILDSIELESSQEMRGVHMMFLPVLFQKIGARTQRWCKRLINLFDHYQRIAYSIKDYTILTSVLVVGLQQFLKLVTIK